MQCLVILTPNLINQAILEKAEITNFIFHVTMLVRRA